MITGQLIRSFKGPNPWSTEPALIVALKIPENAIQAAHDRCGKIAKVCSKWFAPPPETLGTDPSTPVTATQIAQFLVAWSLAALNEIRGALHTARALDQNGEVLVALGCHREEVSLAAMRLALVLFNHIDTISSETLEEELNRLWGLCQQFHPDYQTKFLMQAAGQRNIPFFRFLANNKLWQYGWGANAEVFLESSPMRDSWIGQKISQDKALAKQALQTLGAPIAPHLLVNDERDLADAARIIGWPCVVKPSDRGRSIGVTTNITEMETLVSAFRSAREHSTAPIMIERHIPGDVYRILVVRGRLAYAIRREVPHVFGDGRLSLHDLIAEQNRRIDASLRPGGFLGKIPLDEECMNELLRQKVGLGDVIPCGRKITLRKVPLLSTGAMYSDVTDLIHPHTKAMAEALADDFRLGICGIDFMTDDISHSYLDRGAVLELNVTPGLRVPLMAGRPAEEIGALILGDKPGRIPVSLLLCPEAEISNEFASRPFAPDSGWVIGSTCGLGDRPFVATTLGSKPDVHELTQQVLRNSRCARLFVVTDLETVMRTGLPVDHCDTIVSCGIHPPSEWQRVFSEHSRTYREASDLTSALAEWHNEDTVRETGDVNAA